MAGPAMKPFLRVDAARWPGDQTVKQDCRQLIPRKIEILPLSSPSAYRKLTPSTLRAPHKLPGWNPAQRNSAEWPSIHRGAWRQRMHTMTQWKGMPRPWLLAVVASILLHAGSVVFIARQSLSGKRDIDDPRPLAGILYVQPRPSIASPTPVPPRNERPASPRPRLDSRPANKPAETAAQSANDQPPASHAQRSDSMGSVHHALPSSSLGRDPAGLVLTLPADASKVRTLHPSSNMADPIDRKRPFSQSKDALAEGIKGAAIPDCLSEGPGGGLLGIPIILYRASSGKCK